jgi:4a-hydroxytetrahydrobiopterin dehydratase
VGGGGLDLEEDTMERPRPLDQAAIDEALATAPGWGRADDGALVLRRRLPSAAAAIGFVAAVGALAERHDHHPELRWVYREVELRLLTHDAGDAVTERDVELMHAVAALP